MEVASLAVDLCALERSSTKEMPMRQYEPVPRELHVPRIELARAQSPVSERPSVTVLRLKALLNVTFSPMCEIGPAKRAATHERRQEPKERWNEAFKERSCQERAGHRSLERSFVRFFWWLSMVPPPISKSLASREKRSTLYSSQ